MSDRSPHNLTPSEWKEIAELPVVQESWGLEPGQDPMDLAETAYAARFDFQSGSPGYVGDLYILQGDVLTGDPPMVFRREEGKLVQI
jgi:hypothetical protein